MEKKRRGEQLTTEKIREVAKKEEALQFTEEKIDKDKTGKVNVINTNKKNVVKKKDDKKPSNTTANKTNKGDLTYCAKCDKKTDHETSACTLFCEYCYKPKKIHRGPCWHAKKETVKVAEVEKEEETVEVANNTIRPNQ